MTSHVFPHVREIKPKKKRSTECFGEDMSTLLVNAPSQSQAENVYRDQLQQAEDLQNILSKVMLEPYPSREEADLYIQQLEFQQKKFKDMKKEWDEVNETSKKNKILLNELKNKRIELVKQIDQAIMEILSYTSIRNPWDIDKFRPSNQD